jgi:hypothetical protein
MHATNVPYFESGALSRINKIKIFFFFLPQEIMKMMMMSAREFTHGPRGGRGVTGGGASPVSRDSEFEGLIRRGLALGGYSNDQVFFFFFLLVFGWPINQSTAEPVLVFTDI